ncbi:MAG: LysM peptidoglycan-binding domain-containing protein [Opitutae bacterium]|nr:LysM peptidoglycan-binding domain-containing protein [Opitutae bacterium]
MKALTIISGVVFIHIAAFVLLVNGCSTRASRARAKQESSFVVQPPSSSVSAEFTPAPVESEPVPAATADSRPAASSPAPAPAPAESSTSYPSDETQTYVVKKNDSLWVISRKFNVSIEAICEANGITKNQTLRAGKKLIIPASGTGIKETRENAAVAEGEIYIVQKGDALSTIARRKGTTVAKLKEANHLSNDNIRIGQKLIIPVRPAPKVEEKPAPAPTPAPAAPAEPETAAPAEPPADGVSVPPAESEEYIEDDESSTASATPPPEE